MYVSPSSINAGELRQAESALLRQLTSFTRFGGACCRSPRYPGSEAKERPHRFYVRPTNPPYD